MEQFDKIYIAGHRGLVGSALLRALKQRGYRNLLTCIHAEPDLTRQEAVEHFLSWKMVLVGDLLYLPFKSRHASSLSKGVRY